MSERKFTERQTLSIKTLLSIYQRKLRVLLWIFSHQKIHEFHLDTESDWFSNHLDKNQAGFE